MIGWLDCSAGIAGDMLLGALLDAGASLEVVGGAVRAVDARLNVRTERVQRHQIDCLKVTVVDTSTGRAADDREPGGHHHEHPHGDAHAHHDALGHTHVHHRSHREVRALLDAAGLQPRVLELSKAVFARLARAEGRVHGVDPDEVGFHEVGALDAIGDVVGCCAALVDLDVERLVCSTVTLGHGEQVLGQHGRIPIPGPAVLNIVSEAGLAVAGGPVPLEMTTPTGAALVAELASSAGPMPSMTVLRTGLGAGTRDPERVANLTRLVVGEPLASAPAAPGGEVVLLETNVDDLDPRLWPGLLQALLSAGAQDAWLTPILMKKGRPAHTLSVLLPADLREHAIGLIVRETSSIGLREVPVTKHELSREMLQVEVDGQHIAIKVARWEDEIVNVQPEFDDVVRAAKTLGLPAKIVLQRAHAAASGLLDGCSNASATCESEPS